jgi:hypothetical protein
VRPLLSPLIFKSGFVEGGWGLLHGSRSANIIFNNPVAWHRGLASVPAANAPIGGGFLNRSKPYSLTRSHWRSPSAFGTDS